LELAGVLVRLRQARPLERLGPLAQPRLARLARSICWRVWHGNELEPEKALVLPDSKKTYKLQKTYFAFFADVCNAFFADVCNVASRIASRL